MHVTCYMLHYYEMSHFPPGNNFVGKITLFFIKMTISDTESIRYFDLMEPPPPPP
jgi:hypothetical protein